MSYDPSQGFPVAVAEVLYADTNAAVAWLSRVFGFTEVLRWSHADGRVGHADLQLGSATIMVGGGGTAMRRPADIGQVFTRVSVSVEDLPGHWRRSRSAGAVVLSTERSAGVVVGYRARDLEGHEWEFVQALAPYDNQ